jgi:hypothetical protein
VSRRAFFFPHTLDPKQGRTETNTSGRVPYAVGGTLVGPDGPSEGTCVVMAEGYVDPTSGAGILGLSQDPCVFSAPGGPFHAFSRIDGTKPEGERVVSGGKHIANSLPEAVSKGDVIVYGKTIPPSGKAIDEIWVDTVLVVDSVVELPASEEEKGPWPFPVAAAASFAKPGTDAYRFSLSDAEPKGMHATTGRNPHRIIIGAVEPSAEAVAELRTSFVPLADRRAGVSRVCAVDRGHLRDEWPALIAFFQQQVYLKMKGVPAGGSIAEFESFALAEALLAAIVRRSGGEQRRDLRGVVALPPLRPLDPAKRWDPRTKRVIG